MLACHTVHTANRVPANGIEQGLGNFFANGYRESHFFARHVGACVSTHTLTLSPEDVDPESVEQRYRTTVAPAASASMRQVSGLLEPCREIRLIKWK